MWINLWQQQDNNLRRSLLRAPLPFLAQRLTRMLLLLLSHKISLPYGLELEDTATYFDGPSKRPKPSFNTICSACRTSYMTTRGGWRIIDS